MEHARVVTPLRKLTLSAKGPIHDYLNAIQKKGKVYMYMFPELSR